jgi:coatomer subunit alpha
VAILVSPSEIHIQRIEGDDKKQILRLSDKMTLLRLFSAPHENHLLLTTPEAVLKYDLKAARVVGQTAVEAGAEIRGVVVGRERVALCGKHVLLVCSLELEVEATVHEKFSIQSAFWERDNLLFYTTKNHWKYALLNGETGVLRTLEQPLHLVRKLADRRFLAFNATRKVFEVECPEYEDIEFKLAVQGKEWGRVKEMVQSRLGKKKKNLVGYLVGKGYAAAAVELAESPEERFALAVEASDFQLAFEVCSQINTQEHWRLLGEEALRQGIFNAYELASQKQKHYDRLNFLYSLQNNTPKLDKILKLATKTNNSVLAFNAALFLNNHQEQTHILRDAGLIALAELAHEAQSGSLSDRLKALGSRPLTPLSPEGEVDFSNWPHNEEEREEAE